MFLRFFLTLICFIVITASLTAMVVLVRSPAESFGETLVSVLLAVMLVTLLTVGPAYYLTRNFIRPLVELVEGARRIADGEYGHKVYTGGRGESHTLARTFNSMSERLAAQFAQLEEDSHQLRTILSGMVEGVVAVDADQRVLFANERAAELLDFDLATAKDRKFWEITRQRHLQAIVARVLQGSEPHREEFDWKSPTARYLAVYAAPLRGTRSQGAILVLHDTTELRRLERVRQEFVANVSHELKTPLSVIKACVETLLDGAVEDSSARLGFLEQIAEQSDRLHNLILDLLTLAQIEAGAEYLEIEPVRVEHAVAECFDRLRPRADAKNITLKLHCTPECRLLCVWADEEALSRILDNLIDNAVKYTPAGGQVEVRWHATAETVCLEVEDNGIGIPERDLPRIFERFYRVDKARSRELGGTGLGLSIVKHLAHGMKGTVKATSTLGQGSKFTVCLPRSRDAET